MVLTLGLLLLGLLLLLGGGELLVRGAIRLGSFAGVSPTVIGMTVVAVGTSLPELVVSLEAAIRGNASVAVGNVVGSNIFNIGAIVGIAALIAPLTIRGNLVRFEYPFLLGSSLLCYVFVFDKTVSRLEGSLLLIGFLSFVVYSLCLSPRQATSRESSEMREFVVERTGPKQQEHRSWVWQATLVLSGLALLVVGSNCLVRGASELARLLGAAEVTIGLTVVAAGTSLPELATSVIASLRGQHDVAIANVLGSNIFNVLGIAGLVAIVQPLECPPQILERDIWWMLGFSVLLFPLMKSNLKINRWEGLTLFLVYLFYTVILVSQDA